MNDGIEPELCSLNYTSVDRAVQKILEMGVGTMMMSKVHTGVCPCTQMTDGCWV